MKPVDLLIHVLATWSFVDMYIYSDGPWEIMTRSYERAKRHQQLRVMLMCPKCLGLWTGLVLLVLRRLFPRLYRVVVVALLASGAATIMDHWQRPER